MFSLGKIMIHLYNVTGPIILIHVYYSPISSQMLTPKLKYIIFITVTS